MELQKFINVKKETPIPEKVMRQRIIDAHLCVRFDSDMGWRLSMIRRDLNLKQSEFAHLFELTQQALQKIEKGKITQSSISYLQLKSAIQNRQKNYMSFLFFGPSFENYKEFNRIYGLRAAGMMIPPPDFDLLKGFTWLAK
jgi:DNA-binding XRE family transcriptional regulator